MNKLTNKLNHLSLSTEEKSKFNLLPHQTDAISFIQKKEKSSGICGGFLSMDCGLGKTFTILNHIYTEKEQSKKSTLNLVVCPKTAMYTWKNEVHKFYDGKLNILVFHKDETNINSISYSDLSNYDIIVTNYEFIRSVCTKFKYFDKLRIQDNQERTIGVNVPHKPLETLSKDKGETLLYSIKWNRIIADESHNFSNLKTSLFEAMICLCSKYKWCLSGTPIRNWSNDLYAQYKFLGYIDNNYNLKHFDKTSVLDYIYYCDYEKANIKLPDIEYHDIGCELVQNNEKIYKHYLEKTSEAFDNFIVGGAEFSQILTLFLRLRQICVSPYIVTPDINELTVQEKKEYELSQNELDKVSDGLASWINNKNSTAGLESPKINEVYNIINTIPKGEKVVIFTMFKKVIQLCSEKLSLINKGKKIIIITGDVTGKDREQAINDFKSCKDCILLINYKIGAESLNLTEANHIILIEPWWSFAVIKQATARVARLGQKKNIHVYTLYVKNTKNIISIEEGIMEICNKKKKEAEAVLKNGKHYEDMDKDDTLNAETLYKLISYTTKVKTSMKNNK